MGPWNLMRCTDSLSAKSSYQRSARPIRRLKALTEGRGGVLEPARGGAVDERGQALAHPCVVGVEPGDLIVVEQLGRDEPAVDRRQGQRLKAEHLAVAVGAQRLDDDEVLEADAAGPGLV